MKVVRTIQNDVMDFVAERMPAMFGQSIRNGAFAGLGVLNEDNVLVAGVIFNDYWPVFGTMQVHLAADTPKWATRNVVKEILGYAFLEAKVDKVWGCTPSHLKRVLRFNAGIGFTQEAILRHQYGHDRHCIVTSMMKKEYAKFYIDPEGTKALFRHRQKVQQALKYREAA